MDAIIVTLNTYFKAIQSRLISNYGEFAIIRNQAGLNRFKISVQGHNDSIHLLVLVRCYNVAYIYNGVYYPKAT